MTVDVYTILRVLAEGGHLAVTYPPTRAAKCKLVGPWKDHIPGPSWTASKAMVDKLDATGILDEPTMRIFEDGARIYYFRLRGGRR